MKAVFERLYDQGGMVVVFPKDGMLYLSSMEGKEIRWKRKGERERGEAKG